jgi:hypothetical protein
MVTIEVVGFQGHFLTHYVNGDLVPLEPPEIVNLEYNCTERLLVVSIRRTLPLSSSHGGQPLRLAFHFATGVVAFTESLTVLAKQGKTGSFKKILRPKRGAVLSEARLAAREGIESAIRRSRGAVLLAAGGIGGTVLPGSPGRVVVPILSACKRPRADHMAVSHVTVISAAGLAEVACPAEASIRKQSEHDDDTPESVPCDQHRQLDLIDAKGVGLPSFSTPTLDMLAAAAAADDSPAPQKRFQAAMNTKQAHV